MSKSLRSGIFQQDWKNARVTTIYTDDCDINYENNYRPISVIGHIAKMIESLVSYQIIDFLEEHSFISMDQSAYLKRHSTRTSLHRVIVCINKKKSNVMVIGSKWQLKSLNLDDFTISVDFDNIFLARQAKHLCLWVRNDISWDEHIPELCRKMYYHLHMFRRLKNYPICFTSQHM